jgi:NADPH-dependent curcumin reductase CurA
MADMNRADMNRRLLLAARPSGMVDESIVRRSDAPVPEPGDHEALVRVQYLSIDPTIRTWMDDAPGYLPPIGIGEVIRGAAIGEVVTSNSERYAVGDLVFGMLGWQDFAIAGGGEAALQVLPAGIEPALALNLFGVNGMTAYFGLLEVGALAEGDTVVVSGAAGATGSAVGQIAQLSGAGKVVGLAGTDEKCRWIVDELGFDEAINYKTEPVGRRLRAACPQGIDLYFDNVGGDILDLCLAQIALRGRVVLCGTISTYNDRGKVAGPGNYRNLIGRRGRMEGFIILDYVDRFPEAQAAMFAWLADGKLRHAEHIVNGLESAPDALNLLFTGGNTGKVIVKL